MVWRGVRLARSDDLGPANADRRDHPDESARADVYGADPGLARPADARHVGLRHAHAAVYVSPCAVARRRGQPAFKRDLWLVVLGARRLELTLLEIQQAYAQRFDLEHFFRFGKQRLLLTDFQTSATERETNWLQLVQLAYVQLYLARPLAGVNRRPWERYLPSQPAAPATPSATQRAFAEIIRPIGTPAAAPKRRGIPPGRAKGASPGSCPRYPVVKKTPPVAKKTPNQPQTG